MTARGIAVPPNMRNFAGHKRNKLPTDLLELLAACICRNGLVLEHLGFPNSGTGADELLHGVMRSASRSTEHSAGTDTLMPGLVRTEGSPKCEVHAKVSPQEGGLARCRGSCY